ncbi:MAG TPA: hypothetical protein VKB78_09235 [Pirellulales bacterium]|nr:hypothetical protein [Pirellulales bacterium]
MALGGSLVAGACGIGTIVLAILGLASVVPGIMLGIATLVVGAALLAEGAAIAARHAGALEHGWFNRQAFAMLGSGLTAEFAGGVAGIILGILALLGMATGILIPVAIIVFGASILLGSRGAAEFVQFGVRPFTTMETEHVVHESVFASAGGEAMLAISAIVLGILALIGMVPGTLCLIAFLVLGSAVLLSGSAIAGRMAASLHRA